jgi:hypothetical protein
VFCILNYVKKPDANIWRSYEKKYDYKIRKEKEVFARKALGDCVECGARAGTRGYVSKHKKGCSKAKVKTT